MIVTQASSASTVAVERIYYPLHSIRCAGIGSFRSQSVRDYGCLLDIDDDVRSWRCRPVLEGPDGVAYQADFLVKRTAGVEIVDVMSADRPVPPWVMNAILEGGYGYSLVDPSDYPATRLQNAKDLLRYARYDVPLADRVRLLAALDDLGSLTVAECLISIQASQPIAAIARLVLQRVLEIDLDEALIGPETVTGKGSLGLCDRPLLHQQRQGRIADHLTRPDFIILDELGYLPFAEAGGQLPTYIPHFLMNQVFTIVVRTA